MSSAALTAEATAPVRAGDGGDGGGDGRDDGGGGDCSGFGSDECWGGGECGSAGGDGGDGEHDRGADVDEEVFEGEVAGGVDVDDRVGGEPLVLVEDVGGVAAGEAALGWVVAAGR